ncbi:rad50 [Anaeramoeba flamelloides]|uniref:Rad50 n=1 Tax=Anaeramoeba flamelloides TaxID=1746091 RepID=A0ABQ8Z4Q9_9EUKA|nr:rad50 [Anaeramoeba flamelloides]
MTSLGRALIQGIRSFNPKDKGCLIVFNKPLNVIVGFNGAGKTTIIEALKFVTTGELPPECTRGQSFIYDPDLLGDRVVKAKVTVRFDSIEGKEIFATRHIQVTQNPKSKSFKTLNCEYSIKNKLTNEMHTKTCKQIEMDKIIPHLLGTTNAILQHVIFTHQEESNWPLSKPANLKTIFDQIFESTRYTQALKELKKYKKSINTQLEMFKTELKIAKDNSEHLEKLTNDIERDKQEIEKIQEQIQINQNKIVQRNEIKNQLLNAIQQMDQSNKEINDLQNRIKTNEKLIVSIQENLEEILIEKHSSKELKSLLNNSENTFQQINKEIKQFGSEKQYIKKEIEELNNKAKKLESKSQRIKFEMNEYNSNYQKLEKIGKAITKEFSINFDYNNKENLEKFVKNKERELKMTEKEIEKWQNEQNGELEKKKMKSTMATSQRKSLEKEIRSKQKELNNINRQFLNNEKLLDKINNSENEQLEKEIEKKKNDLNNFEEKADLLNNEKIVDRNFEQQEELNKKLKKLEKRNKILNQNRETLTELKLKQEQFDKINEKYELMKNGSFQEIQKHLTNKRIKKNFSKQLEKVQLTNKKEKKKIENKLKEINSNISSINGELSLHQKNKLKFKNDIQEKKKQLNELMEDFDFNDDKLDLNNNKKDKEKDMGMQIEEKEGKGGINKKSEKKKNRSKKNEKKKKKGKEKDLIVIDSDVEKSSSNESSDDNEEEEGGKGKENSFEEFVEKCNHTFEKYGNKCISFSNTKEIYVNFLDEAEETKKCPVCSSNLKTKKAYQKFKDQTNDKIQEIVTLLSKVENKYNKIKKTSENLEQIKPIWNEMNRIENKELPPVKLKIKKINEKIVTMNEKQNSYQDKFQELQLKEKTLERLISEAKKYEELLNEKTELEKIIKNLKKNTITSNENEFEENENQIEKYKVDIEKLKKNTKEIREKLKNDRNEINNSRNIIKKLEKRLNKYRQEIKEFEKAKNQKQFLEENLNELNKKLSSSKKEEKMETKDYNEQKQLYENEKKIKLIHIKEIKKQFSKLKNLFDKYYIYYEKIQNFNKIEKDELTEKITQEINEYQDLVDKKKKSTKTISNNIKEREQLLKNSNRRKNVIHQNLKLLKRKNEKKEYVASYRNLNKAKKEKWGDRDYYKESEQVKNEIQQLKQMIYGNKGQIKSIRQYIKEKEKEKNQKKYRNSRINYQTRKINFEVSKITMIDIDKFHKSLEEALVRYHELKMEEINKIIHELWVKTYRGNDIDTIKITSSPSSNSKKRTYNYQVLMVTKDNELEMRGRCSSGQKVLASLIIRLALAEAFCINCGIMALDEPTTNLDRVNVENFAESLGSIISNRSKQSNFQLLVITHDEHFVNLLGKSGYSNHYHRVYKDQNGMSNIKMENFTELL